MDDKRYTILYADPPWTYRDKAVAGERGAGFKYPTLDLQALERLPVAALALGQDDERQATREGEGC
jgi:hypothetical protein